MPGGCALVGEQALRDRRRALMTPVAFGNGEARSGSCRSKNNDCRREHYLYPCVEIY